jgi:phospho-N-acetylmuramoyl-pentapeptide-transferase
VTSLLWVLALGLLSFAVAIAWAPALLANLRRLKMGKQIREEGPQSHMSKAGTPTMGGWLMVATAAVLALIFLRDWQQFVLPLVAMLVFALFGSADDLANMRSRTGHGFQVRWKFLTHGVVALGFAFLLFLWVGLDHVWVPFVGWFSLGWLYVPLAALVIFSGAAAVNETDGLDGLAGGLSAIAFAVYGAIAAANGQYELAAFCALVVGATLAFLWFNVNPASVFMGDAGSLALGAGLSVVALLTGHALLLPLIGVVFVAETASVMIQVAYFKYTKGRRIFKMAPLHHHFELVGWTEVQTVQRFWLVGAIAGAMGLALFLT